MFAEQAELHRYTRYIVEHFGLRDRVELQANVERVEWDDESKRWAVHTAGKGTFYAQFLINATGPLSQPVVPRFEGQERFRGKTFTPTTGITPTTTAKNAWPSSAVAPVRPR